jgi:hypothetical protein
LSLSGDPFAQRLVALFLMVGIAGLNVPADAQVLKESEEPTRKTKYSHGQEMRAGTQATQGKTGTKETSSNTAQATTEAQATKVQVAYW